MVFNPFSPFTQAPSSFLRQSIASVSTIFVLLLLRYAYLDYRAWYALGGGGIPHNVFGWLVQSLLRLRASRNVRDSGCYDAAIKSNELERTSFLKDQLPAWTGKAPETGVWVAPHRQLDQVANAEIKKGLKAMITKIVDLNPKSFESGPSQIEGGAPALFVTAQDYNSGHASCSRSPREVFHSHCSTEGSSHAVLSAADAKLVLDNGWGERHGISGRALGFPLNYVLIFAPRSTQEVKIVEMIARAAARYGLEGKLVNDLA